MKSLGNPYVLFVIVVIIFTWFFIAKLYSDKDLKEPTHLTRGILLEYGSANRLKGIYKQGVRYIFLAEGKYIYGWQQFDKYASWITEGNEVTIRYEENNPAKNRIISIQKKDKVDHILLFTNGEGHEQVYLNNQLFIRRQFNLASEKIKEEYGIFSIDEDTLFVQLLESDKIYQYIKSSDSLGNLHLLELNTGKHYR